MWKYTHTDEMYHSLTSGNKELFHSDIYLGQEYSDGLKHYKYLKKVKSPSGKWRYIYDETDLKKEEKKIKALTKTRDTLRDEDGDYRYIDKDGNSVYRNKDGSTVTIFGNSKRTKKDEYKEKIYNSVEDRKKKHRKQKIKDIPKRVISRGIGAVNKFLYDTEKKWIR